MGLVSWIYRKFYCSVDVHKKTEDFFAHCPGEGGPRFCIVKRCVYCKKELTSRTSYEDAPYEQCTIHGREKPYLVWQALLLCCLFPFAASAQQMCGDYENPLQTPVTTELEHILCTDLFFCTDLTYQLNDAIVRGLNREIILRERIAKLRRKLKKNDRA